MHCHALFNRNVAIFSLFQSMKRFVFVDHLDSTVTSPFYYVTPDVTKWKFKLKSKHYLPTRCSTLNLFYKNALTFEPYLASLFRASDTD